ncbi:hypothetical protein T492DRAFT_841585 [Pavlovales sp. CCMP2436]|nr:hypothetical protein T492DRAFT_841585 [Pavlovales sp. CCMP2436]
MTVPTAAISLLSCAHGHQRREEERHLERRDLQAAVKHGSRQLVREHRWKLKHDGVVYITDHALKREITSYRVAAPMIMRPVELTPFAKFECEAAKLTAQREPASWTSHTLERGRARPTDIVTVLEMGEGATTRCTHEPLTWSLLNDMLSFVATRKLRSHGNYMPALAEAERLLMATSGSHPGSIRDKHVAIVRKRVGSLASQLGRRLTISAVGFGPPEEDFAVLRAMAEEATRTELTAIGSMRQRDVHSVLCEAKSCLNDGAALVMSDWDVYSHTWKACSRLADDSEGTTDLVIAEPFAGSRARAVMVHNRIYGKGAERMVHRFHELDASDLPVGPPLIAKESRFVHQFNSEEHIEYHYAFVRTQMKAARITHDLNDVIRLAPSPSYLSHWHNATDTTELTHRQNARGEAARPAAIRKMEQQHGVRARPGPGRGEQAGVYSDVPSVGQDDAELGVIAESDEEANSYSEGLKLSGLTRGIASISIDSARGIHYASSTGRRCVYGRTDRGSAGMASFFSTHKCNSLCVMLGLRPRGQQGTPPGGRALLGGEARVAGGNGRKHTPVRMPALHCG